MSFMITSHRYGGPPQLWWAPSISAAQRTLAPPSHGPPIQSEKFSTLHDPSTPYSAARETTADDVCASPAPASAPDSMMCHMMTAACAL